MSDINNNLRACIRFSIIFDPTITVSEIRLYSLIEQMESNTGSVFFSNAWLAERLGIEERGLRRVIKKLKDKNFIKRTYNPNKKKWVWNTVRPGEIEMDDCEEGGACEAPQGGASQAPQGGASQAPYKTQLTKSHNYKSLSHQTTSSNQTELQQQASRLREMNKNLKEPQLIHLIDEHGYQHVKAQLERMIGKEVKDDYKYLRALCERNMAVAKSESPQREKSINPPETMGKDEIEREWPQIKRETKEKIFLSCLVNVLLFEITAEKHGIQTYDDLENLDHIDGKMLFDLMYGHAERFKLPKKATVD